MNHPFILLLSAWLVVPMALAAPAAPVTAPTAPPVAVTSHRALSYQEWVAACQKLPSNRSLRGRLPPKALLPLKEFRALEEVLSAFFEQSKSGPLRQLTNWIGEQPDLAFFNPARAYFEKPTGAAAPVRFQPFAQKLSIPPGAQVFFRGDLHGDIHSLVRNLQWLNQNKLLEGFKIVPPNFYMIFLGDYTDRGMYGTEVVYTLLRLKLANPDRVFMARGNHEDLSLLLRYGYFQEGQAKFGSAFNMGKVARAFDFLPVVIYLESGNNLLQCNHGGLEPGFDPRSLINAPGSVAFQLIGTLRQGDFFQNHPQWLGGSDASSRDLAARALRNFLPDEPTAPSVLGFMWNDFTVLSQEPWFALDPGRAFVYGHRATEYILNQASTTNRKVQAVFRAHQHSSALTPLMRRLVASKGVHRHWQEADSPALLNASPTEIARHLDLAEKRSIPSGSVWTFNVGADSAYGEGCGFDFDTFGLLQTAAAFTDWRLQVVNIPLSP